MQFLTRLRRALLEVIFPLSPEEKRVLSQSARALRAGAREASACPLPSHRAVLSYKDPTMKTLIRLLKYRGDKDAAELCAELLVDALEEMPLPRAGEPFLVVPIPLFPARLRTRGFNQSARIAQRLVTLSHNRGTYKLEYAQDGLRRVRDTGSQTSLSGRARQENVRGAFALAPSANVRGRAILVLDDVTTTGATFREAERVLREAGARSVVCLAVAH